MSDEEGRRLAELVDREREAHTTADVLGASEDLKSRFSHTLSYPSRANVFGRLDDAVNEVGGLAVLDYGCGRGELSVRLLGSGASVVGIDVSSVYIDAAKLRAADAGFEGEDARFLVMDAHSLELEDQSLDMVIGQGILHHLETDLALDEIHRVLRDGGKCYLLEPLNGNPLLRLFRLITPKARTKDEHPFIEADLRRIESSANWAAKFWFCGAVAAPVAALTSVIPGLGPSNLLVRLASRADTRLGRGRLRSWNQYVLFELTRAPRHRKDA